MTVKKKSIRMYLFDFIFIFCLFLFVFLVKRHIKTKEKVSVCLYVVCNNIFEKDFLVLIDYWFSAIDEREHPNEKKYTNINYMGIAIASSFVIIFYRAISSFYVYTYTKSCMQLCVCVHSNNNTPKKTPIFFFC